VNRQFSLVHLTTPGCPPPEIIYLAKRAGFDHVSLRSIPMGLANEPNFSMAKNRELLEQTRRALIATGVRLHDTENARIADGVNVLDYLAEIEIAAELGARYVLTNIWTGNHSFIVDQLGRLCDLAKRCGIGVIVEFVTWASVRTLDEVVRLIAEIGSDNAGIVLDTLHFNRSRCTLDDLERVPPRLLRFVHLCDAPSAIPQTIEGLIHAGRAERLYVGEGGIDIAAIIRRLPEMVLGVELPHLARIAEIGRAEHVFRCMETTRAYLARYGL
jgi:sugar phosphate isomerase/epimerase